MRMFSLSLTPFSYIFRGVGSNENVGGGNFVRAQGPTAPLEGGRGGGTISCDLSLERESHAQS